jgi:hypothetical protein
MISLPAPSTEDIKRFFSRTRVGENGCLIWVGERGYEYGIFAYQGVKTVAHRFAYLVQYGSIPEGKIIRHSNICKDGFCVEHSHLVPGTQRENMEDRKQRGWFLKQRRA